MKIEYLLIKSNNDFCSNMDQFKSLLQSNRRIIMDDEHITFSGVSLGYTLNVTEVDWRGKKEIVFYFTVCTDEQNVEALEGFDVLLHRINDKCGSQFKVNTVWDDVSIHYTKELYPAMVEVENLLRKLIYRFMIKTAGSAWFSYSTPESVKDAVKKTAEKNSLDELPDVDQLYLTDFIQLGWFFFEKYTTKPLNQTSIQELKKIMDDKDGMDVKMAAFLETYEARSNWERYFEDKIEVDNLYDKWRSLYGYRNRVAHAKRLNGEDYKTAVNLISELKSAFEKCLDHIDNVEMTEEEAEAVQEVAKETISMPRKQSSDIRSYSMNYPGIVPTLSELATPVLGFASQADISSLSSGILQLTGQQKQAFDNACRIANSLPVNTLLIGDTYQKPLRAMKLATDSLVTMPKSVAGES